MSSTGAPHLSQMSVGDEENFSNIEDIDVAGAEAYGFFPEAMPRQLTAIFKAGDRSNIIREISVPTLVQHGENDTLLPEDHGEHTAQLIDGSQYKVYSDMGHNLPPEVLPFVMKDMIQFFKEKTFPKPHCLKCIVGQLDRQSEPDRCLVLCHAVNSPFKHRTRWEPCD